MSGGLNPVALIQLMMGYNIEEENGLRTFAFTKHNKLRVHKETEQEASCRRTNLPTSVKGAVFSTIRNKILPDILRKKAIGKVWIHPDMKKIAVPLQMATSESGWGVLPTGSKLDIPEGKHIRFFTYWEKVNDIDLSCIGLQEDGSQIEFSWRREGRWRSTREAICFSGDETAGYNGGSEYFDINIEEFRKAYPKVKYLIGCDNIYSPGCNFCDVLATGGFMVREDLDRGEIFEPKTVATSFRLTSDVRFTYMFAIDLENRQMIWLNIADDRNSAIAGTNKLSFLKRYLEITDMFNMYDLFSMMGTVVSHPSEADIIVSDKEIPGLINPRDWISGTDCEKILKILAQ